MTTSAASAGSARPGLLDHESVVARMAGVVVSPRRTFGALAAAPRALDVLLLAWLAAFACTAALLQTGVGELALVDQWERTAIAFGQQVGDVEYAALQQAARRGAAYAAATALASGPALAAALAGVLFLAFRRARRSVRYAQVLAIAAHASVILALRQIVAAPVSYARESLTSPTSASMFLTMVDEGSPVTRFFGLIDLFVIWWLVVLAIGLSVLYGRSARRIALTFAGIYLVMALVVAGLTAALGGLA